ncbi:MAG: alpha-2-macroglobulin family protein [Bacteroidota bacterium]
MKKVLSRLSILLLLSLLVFGCKNKPAAEEPIVPEYNPLISAFTSGIISSESSVMVRFAENFADSVIPGSPVEKGVLTIVPETRGSVSYVDQRTIQFTPETRFRPGTAFQVKVRVGKLFSGDAASKPFVFSFHTVVQHIMLSTEAFRPYNDYKPELNYIVGKLMSADVAEPEAVGQIIVAKQDGRTLHVSWDHLSGTEHQFTIDSVRRGEEDSRVLISYDATPAGAEEKGEIEFTVPSLGSFQVLNYRVVQYPEQQVIISFSDPIKRDQNLTGLIRLATDTDLRFSVEGNNVSAFPEVRQNGTVTVFVEPGIRNVAGKGLLRGEQKDLRFEEIKPAVQLLGNGVIIPTTDKVQLPFKAVNLKAVEVKVVRIYENNVAQFLQVNQLNGNRELKRAGRLVLHKNIDLISDKAINYGEWNVFSLDLTQLIKTEPGAIYRVEIGFNRNQSLYPCPDNETEKTEESQISSYDYSEEEEFSYWDSYENYYYDDDYDYYDYEGYEWRDRDDPCKQAYYGSRRSVSRNILASNLGLIAKHGTDGAYYVTVTDLIKSGPLSGATVRLYNYQQQLMAEETTNSDGTAVFKTGSQPFLVVAEQGVQKGYLRLIDGAALSSSMFDVSGVVINKGLKGFIYGDRGVWRPGDSLYLSFILNDKANPLPENHPVLFELKDPQGKIVARKVSTGNKSGFYSFHTKTAQDAITGNYTVSVKAGGTSFSKLLSVETVKPNRLKIELDFGTDTIFAAHGEIAGKISSRWLTGAKASNLKAEVEVILFPVKTSFKKYDGYIFDDPTRELSSYPTTIYSGETDISGVADFRQDLEISGEAPGMLSARFTTRVFEKSGDFSIDQASVPCSPYAAYVGIRVPPGDKRGMLLTDTLQTVKVATLDPSGKPLSLKKLEAKVYKLDWRWWWDASSDNLASYAGGTYHSPLFSKTISTSNGNGEFSFMVKYPDWGRYLVLVSDPAGGHAAGKIVYIDWPGYAGKAKKGDPNAASILTFSSDKPSYNVGEEAEIAIPSSTRGKLFISIETGSGVLKQEWIDASGSETRYRFRITPEMTPNVYVFATLLQPHAQTVNDLPVRMYGIIPILVEDPETRLEPQISMPDELRPNSTVEIRVSEKNRKAMTYTIAVVDEGLLDLTRFRTPDPWSSFFSKEALGVKTWDLFDMVLGAWGGRMDGVYNVGGDGSDDGNGAREANRFPPMVKFLGPFTSDGKEQVHKVNIPNYIGSVRTMVVAGNRGAYGNTEKTTPVRQPLMVLATLPRVLGPEEEVALPVDIFVMDEKIRDVDVKITTNDLLIAANKTGKVSFDGIGDKIVTFNLKTAASTGLGKVSVEVSSGREKAVYEIELQVRSSNPPVTGMTTAVLNPGETLEQPLEYVGMAGTNDLVLELSSIPPVDFGRRLRYLLQYPHGCIEQTTSAAFPQLYLGEIMELTEGEKQKADFNIKAAILRLGNFQTSDGGFSYWPGSAQVSSWGTSYAGHFLVEAKKKGYDIPSSLYSGWEKYQKKEARRWNLSGVTYTYEIRQEQILQSYRLFTLALGGSAEIGAMNRLRERTDLCTEAKWRLAAAYALAGQKETARQLITGASVDIPDYDDSGYSYGSGTRDRAMILEAMVLMDMKKEAVPVLEMVAKALSSEQWMSTQTTAYSLIAVCSFTEGRATSDRLSFEYRFNNGETRKAETTMPYAQVRLDPGLDTKGKIRITNQGKQMVFARFIQTGTPLPGTEKALVSNLELSVEYRDLENRLLDVSQLQQGTDFKAVFRIKNTGRLGYYKTMALSSIFPSGWEIHNERLFSTMDSDEQFDYQDIRDDRVLTYFSLAPNATRVFTVRLNAAYSGKFYLPAVKAEEMYRNDIQALIPGKWVVVEKGE